MSDFLSWELTLRSVNILQLSEQIAQKLDLHEWTHALIEDIIDAVDDRDRDAVLLIDLLDTLGAIIAFGHHLHLKLSGFH